MNISSNLLLVKLGSDFAEYKLVIPNWKEIKKSGIHYPLRTNKIDQQAYTSEQHFGKEFIIEFVIDKNRKAVVRWKPFRAAQSDKCSNASRNGERFQENYIESQEKGGRYVIEPKKLDQ